MSPILIKVDMFLCDIGRQGHRMLTMMAGYCHAYRSQRIDIIRDLQKMPPGRRHQSKFYRSAPKARHMKYFTMISTAASGYEDYMLHASALSSR